MPTVRLIPSTYYLSNSSYLSVSNASNMYANTDSTNYATVTNSRTSTTSYYIYIRGFNFNAVPADAIVSDISIKLKAYHSGGNTSTIQCYDGTTAVSSAGSTTALTTSATVKTFTNTTIDWDTLKSYGSDFGIRINCRRNSRNTAAYIYVYGAEIDVTYTLPVYYDVTASGDGTLVPSGTTSVLEGDSYSLTISGITPTVTDNGVDVTSQLEQVTGGTDTLIPFDNDNSGFTVANIENAYHDATNTTYASLELAGGASSGTIYLELGEVPIPATATITAISCSLTYQYNRNNSSSGYSASARLYADTTAKGSALSLVSAGGTDVAKTTVGITTGTWTGSEIQNARLQITATNNASSTHRFLYVYGVSLTVTYTVDGVVYVYTIESVMTNHTIVVTAGASTTVMYIKVNGQYIAGTAVYKKINGAYVQQSDLTAVFDSGTQYHTDI